jgi:hypothetical protein
MPLLSSYAFVCQNILTEKDGVSSAIRIVELFFIPKVTDPEALDHLPPATMYLYINLRFTPNESEPHTVSFDLIRPDGETTSHAVMENTVLAPAKYAGLDTSIMIVGQVGVAVKKLGRHEFVVMLDGQKITSTVFTLLEAEDPSEAMPPESSEQELPN